MTERSTEADEAWRRELMSECANYDLRRAARAVGGLYDDAVRDAGITGTQFSMLRLIQVQAGVSISVLGRYMCMDRTSVTRALNPLQRQGFVAVVPNESDRRIREIRLTGAGEEVVARAENGWKSAQSTLMDAIGPDRWSNLRVALRDTTKRVRRIGKETAADH